MRILYVLAALALSACKHTTAPEQPCVPNFSNPDSSKTMTTAGDTAYVIRIAWCGPISVQ